MENLLKNKPHHVFRGTHEFIVVGACSGVTLMSRWWMAKNIVPPTVRSVSHSVWQIGSDHAAGRKRVFWSDQVLKPPRRCVLLGVFACACGIEVCLMYSHSWGTVGGDEETAGRAKGECNEECV